MKIIPAAKFKAHCLSILDEVASSHEPVVVTKHGKSVARVVPHSDSRRTFQNPLKNSVVFEKNIVDPLGIKWEADQ